MLYVSDERKRKSWSACLWQTYNMGTGQGVSVLQLIDAFQRSCGIKIPYEFKPRREGDIVAMYGNVSLAKDELGWNAQYSLEQMCKCFL